MVKNDEKVVNQQEENRRKRRALLILLLLLLLLLIFGYKALFGGKKNGLSETQSAVASPTPSPTIPTVPTQTPTPAVLGISDVREEVVPTVAAVRLIECVGPDGKIARASKADCDNLWAFWNAHPPAPNSSGSNSSSSENNSSSNNSNNSNNSNSTNPTPTPTPTVTVSPSVEPSPTPVAQKTAINWTFANHLNYTADDFYVMFDGVKYTLPSDSSEMVSLNYSAEVTFETLTVSWYTTDNRKITLNYRFDYDQTDWSLRNWTASIGSSSMILEDGVGPFTISSKLGSSYDNASFTQTALPGSTVSGEIYFENLHVLAFPNLQSPTPTVSDVQPTTSL